jgi:hypothetical protein
MPEGRDKFCKLIQYQTRFWMAQTADSNPELSKQFRGMFSTLQLTHREHGHRTQAVPSV